MNSKRPSLGEIFTPEIMSGKPRQSLDEIFNSHPALDPTPPLPEQNPNDFMKIKANPNASFNDSSGIKETLLSPLKSTANMATFPLRSAKMAGEALESGKQLVKEQGLKAPYLASEGALDVGGHIAEKGFELLSNIGNAVLGGLAKGVKKTTGMDLGTPEAKKAVDTVIEHLLNHKLADATTIVAGVHKKFVENPEEVLLWAQQLNKLAGHDVIAETAQKFGSNQIQSGVDTAINTTGNVVAGAGRAMKGVAEKVYEHAITPDTQEAEQLLDYRSKKPFLERVGDTLSGKDNAPQTRASTALDKGIAGTEGHIGTQARSIKEGIWNKEIGPALDKSKAVMSKEELFSPIEKRIAETVEPAKRMAFQDAYEAIKDEYKDINNIPIKDVQNIKSTLDKFTPDKLWRGKPVASEYNVLRADMANAARGKIYAALGPEVQQSYADWSNLNDLESVGVKAISNAGFKGGAGTMVSHLWDAATVPIKTIGGQVLYKVGNAFEFLGEQGIKKFGDFLADRGFAPPLAPQGSNPSTNNPQNSPSNNDVSHDGIISQTEDKVKNYIKHPKLGNAIEDVSPQHIKSQLQNNITGGLDKAVQSGDLPANQVFQVDGQTLNASVAKGRIDDIAANLKNYYGDEVANGFKNSVDVNSVTFKGLEKQVNSIIDNQTYAMNSVPKTSKSIGSFGDTTTPLPDTTHGLSNPQNLKANLSKLQPFDVKKAIEAGDIPRSDVYGSPMLPSDPTLLNPKYAVSLAEQIAERMDLFQKGLGAKFFEGLNVYKMTEPMLLDKANQMINFIEHSVAPQGQAGLNLHAFHQEINDILRDSVVDEIGVLKNK